MNKNTKTKVLLAVVILIWGYFGISLYSGFGNSDELAASIDKSSFKAPKILEREVFELEPIESDPFLGTLYKKQTAKVRNKTTTPKKETLIWPNIKYSGIVSDNNSASSVFILTVNGQQHLLRKGDTIQKLKILKGSKNNILIQFEGVTKEFSLM